MGACRERGGGFKKKLHRTLKQKSCHRLWGAASDDLEEQREKERTGSLGKNTTLKLHKTKREERCSGRHSDQREERPEKIKNRPSWDGRKKGGGEDEANHRRGQKELKEKVGGRDQINVHVLSIRGCHKKGHRPKKKRRRTSLGLRTKNIRADRPQK